MFPVRVDPEVARQCSEQAWSRTEEIVGALQAEDARGESWAATPSLLAGWTRLTVACHLRYGARACRRMTSESLERKETSFYPAGRATQRPGTLVAAEGESSSDVLASLLAQSRRLHELWSGLSPSQWQTRATEPAANPDLGAIPLGVLAVLRLTEVDVHGVDLDVGLSDWSELFVRVALPVRLAMLASRRRDPSLSNPGVEGSWKLIGDDGLCWVVSLRDGVVNSEPADPDATADAEIRSTSRDLIAMLLGRPRDPGVLSGNAELARSFTKAFPAP